MKRLDMILHTYRLVPLTSKRIIKVIRAWGVLALIFSAAGCKASPEKAVLGFPGALDGKFAISFHPSHEIYVVDKDNLDTPDVIYSVPDMCWIYPPLVWSPDGTEIVFMIESGGSSADIAVLKFDTSRRISDEILESEVISTTSACNRINGPVWTRDGIEVILGCSGSKFFIWDKQTQDTRDVMLPKVVDALWQGDTLRWGPESYKHSLFVNVRREDPDSGERLADQAWLLNINTGGHEVLMDCRSLVGRDSCWFRLSPSGRRVGFLTLDQYIYFTDLESDEVVVYELPEGTNQIGVWSPDETRMVFGGEDLRLLHLDTGRIEVLQEGYRHEQLFGRTEWVEFRSPQWLDDDHIAMVRVRSQSIPDDYEGHTTGDRLFHKSSSCLIAL